MDIENLPFPDAVRFLAKRAGMEVPEEETDREAGRRRQRLLDLNRDAARFYYQLLQQPEGRPFRLIWTNGRLKNPQQSNSAWAPPWTLGRASDRHDQERLLEVRAAGRGTGGPE